MPDKSNEMPVVGAEEPEERRQRVKAGNDCFSCEIRIQKDDVVEEYDITMFVILAIFIIAVLAWFVWYT
ncbi:hypothetical protein AAVH_08580 [Aphelenchoides avenae]|nr:hypothetical protein AAVH_08580 [Aphelenchus avenae]